MVFKSYWSQDCAVVLLVKAAFWHSCVPDSGQHEKQQSAWWARPEFLLYPVTQHSPADGHCAHLCVVFFFFCTVRHVSDN